MTLDVLVPFRATTKHRQQIHDYSMARWEALQAKTKGISVHVADDGQSGELFSVSRAVNRAYRQGTGDNVMVFGSGHIPPTRKDIERVQAELARAPWMGVFTATRILTQTDTLAILDGKQIRSPRTLTARTVPFCQGIIAMRRETFADVGGYDSRFVGWGYEDTTMRLVLARLHGEPAKPSGELTTLWHPAKRPNFDANKALHAEYVGAEDLRAYIQRRGSFV